MFDARSHRGIFRFFAGFCLIVNGAYIGAGAFGGVADAGAMLRHGSPAWVSWLFGVFAVAAGWALWHGQEHRFGLPDKDGRVSAICPRVVWSLMALCVVLLAASFILARVLEGSVDEY